MSALQYDKIDGKRDTGATTHRKFEPAATTIETEA